MIEFVTVEHFNNIVKNDVSGAYVCVNHNTYHTLYVSTLTTESKTFKNFDHAIEHLRALIVKERPLIW